MHVNNLPRVALDSVAAWVQTRNLLIASPAPKPLCHTLHRHSLSILTAIFQVNLGKPVFIEAEDDGSGGDNWSYKS